MGLLVRFGWSQGCFCIGSSWDIATQQISGVEKSWVRQKSV